MQPDNTTKLSRDDVRRILFSCLRPATKLAEELTLPLSELRDLVELAYYQRGLASGHKKSQISTKLGIGMTKAAELSQKLKRHFLAPEEEHGLPRQILSLLWASPLTRAQIAKTLASAGSDAIDQGLEQLLSEGRIQPIRGRTTRFAPVKSVQRLSIVPWMARIDGLNTLMDHVSLAIDARFGRQDDRSLVRNITFQVAPESTDQLQTFYEEQLIPLIVALDEQAQHSAQPVTIKMSMLWAPEDSE